MPSNSPPTHDLDDQEKTRRPVMTALGGKRTFERLISEEGIAQRD
jgi:hypothetical protein